MAADYPGAIKNFLTLEDGVDNVLAQHMNERGDEITAIETELGADVAGSMSDLMARLTVALNNDGTFKPGALTSYDSGWFAIAADTDYDKTHGLGTTKILASVYFSTSSDGTGALLQGVMGRWYTEDKGSSIKDLTTTTFTFQTTAIVGWTVDDGGTCAARTSGYARVIMLALS